MVVLQLNWQQSAVLTAVLLAVALTLARSARRRTRAAGMWLREAAVIAALYGLWQLASELSLHRTAGAFVRAAWIRRTERSWGLPPEADLTRPLLAHRWLGEIASLYYDTMHFTVAGVFLVWLFWRHRDRYPATRLWLATVTAACLLVQLAPVAPPRFLPGFTDVAAHYGRSVYASGAFGADQLSAMPSVHVAWAVLVGVVVVVVSTSRWRWIALAHPLLTVWVVVATANHWWLDGVVALVLLALTGGAQYAVTRRVRADRGLSRQRDAQDPVVSAGRLPAAVAVGRGDPQRSVRGEHDGP